MAKNDMRWLNYTYDDFMKMSAKEWTEMMADRFPYSEVDKKQSKGNQPYSHSQKNL